VLNEILCITLDVSRDFLVWIGCVRSGHICLLAGQSKHLRDKIAQERIFRLKRLLQNVLVNRETFSNHNKTRPQKAAFTGRRGIWTTTVVCANMHIEQDFKEIIPVYNLFNEHIGQMTLREAIKHCEKAKCTFVQKALDATVDTLRANGESTGKTSPIAQQTRAALRLCS
jgi:hypothetical protein